MDELPDIIALEKDGAFGDELPPGTQLCYGQYTIEKYLNSGGFGVTYLARDSLDRRVVIKECFPNAMCCRSGNFVRLRSRSLMSDFERVVELFDKEARALAHLQHHNVVAVHQIFRDNGTAYMALDYIEGMDLLDVLDKAPEVLTPDKIKSLLLKLLGALTYVHDNGILHRDISPDNILLDHAQAPILIDFGAAREGATRASRILSRIHTVKDGYSPQEFYFSGSSQSPSSDLYALAATFYHLISKSPPPNSNLRLAAVAENRPDPYEPLAGRFDEYDAAVLATIDRCMSLFLKDRIESASAWRDEIKGGMRGPVQQMTAERAEAIERTVAELVSAEQAVEPQAPETDDDAVRRAEMEAQAEADRRAAEREYWAILSEDVSGGGQARKDAVNAALIEQPWRAPEAQSRGEEAGRLRLSLTALLPWSSRRRHGLQNSNV